MLAIGVDHSLVAIELISGSAEEGDFHKETLSTAEALLFISQKQQIEVHSRMSGPLWKKSYTA